MKFFGVHLLTQGGVGSLINSITVIMIVIKVLRLDKRVKPTELSSSQEVVFAHLQAFTASSSLRECTHSKSLHFIHYKFAEKVRKFRNKSV